MTLTQHNILYRCRGRDTKWLIVDDAIYREALKTIILILALFFLYKNSMDFSGTIQI